MTGGPTETSCDWSVYPVITRETDNELISVCCCEKFMREFSVTVRSVESNNHQGFPFDM